MHLLNRHVLKVFTETYLSPQIFKFFSNSKEDKKHANKFCGRSLRQKAPLREHQLLPRNRL